MQIKPLHQNFILPTKATDGAGAFDIYMVTPGIVQGVYACLVPLGFSTAIPPGYVALILPRSGIGAKRGLELNNTVGVIDSDYRGEWKAMLRLKDGQQYSWEAGDRLLQFLIVPIADVKLELVTELTATGRDTAGFGSTGK